MKKNEQNVEMANNRGCYLRLGVHGTDHAGDWEKTTFG